MFKERKNIWQSFRSLAFRSKTDRIPPIGDHVDPPSPPPPSFLSALFAVVASHRGEDCFTPCSQSVWSIGSGVGSLKPEEASVDTALGFEEA